MGFSKVSDIYTFMVSEGGNGAVR